MDQLSQPVGHTTLWLGFAALAVATSYVMRLLAARATRAGERRLESARAALGLAPREAEGAAKPETGRTSRPGRHSAE